MLRLITDFDGPIMDVSDRYYEVYKLCLEKTKKPDQQVKQMSKAEFWALKRARVPEKKIGILSGLTPDQSLPFARLRRETVHTLPYLVHDQPIPQAIETLEKLQKLGVDLVVMTMRRTRELESAFSRYPLERFFSAEKRYCLTNDYVKTTDVQDKPLLMAKAMAELPPAEDVWMVGDTEADIMAAKTHNIKIVAVLSGIRDRQQLESNQPDYIVNNLVEAAELITTLAQKATNEPEKTKSK